MVNQRKRPTKEQVYEVVWPLGRSVSDHVKPAPRVLDLSGKTVCELWDSIFRGEEIFPLIRERLGERYSGIKFVDYRVFGSTHGQTEKEVIAALPVLLHKQGCDVVISGIGA